MLSTLRSYVRTNFIIRNVKLERNERNFIGFLGWWSHISSYLLLRRSFDILDDIPIFSSIYTFLLLQKAKSQNIDVSFTFLTNSISKILILQVRAAFYTHRHDMPWDSLLRVQFTRSRVHHCPIVTVQDVFARRFFRERGKVLWLILAEWIKTRIREVRYY